MIYAVVFIWQLLKSKHIINYLENHVPLYSRPLIFWQKVPQSPKIYSAPEVKHGRQRERCSLLPSPHQSSKWYLSYFCGFAWMHQVKIEPQVHLANFTPKGGNRCKVWFRELFTKFTFQIFQAFHRGDHMVFIAIQAISHIIEVFLRPNFYLMYSPSIATIHGYIIAIDRANIRCIQKI